MCRVEDADLRGAHLEAADLRSAHLESADLGGTHLEGTDLRGADLGGSSRGVHPYLTGASDLEVLKFKVVLSEAQLATAYGDAATQLPAGLVRPAHWPGADTDPAPPAPDAGA